MCDSSTSFSRTHWHLFTLGLNGRTMWGVRIRLMTTILTDTYKHVGVNHKNWPVTWKQNSLAGIRPRGCRSLVIAPL